MENESQNLMTEKASQPHPAPPKRNEVFQKKSIEKAGFYFQKFEKYLKSKNHLKRLLGAFNQEL